MIAMSLTTLRLSETGLRTVETAREKKKWRKDEVLLMQEAHVSRSTLYRFWSRAPLSQELFNEICAAFEIKPQEVSESGTGIGTRQMNFTVLNDDWVGRDHLIENLVAQIHAARRIVLLLGITGIGKTALAETLVVHLRGEFDELRENWENDRPQDFVTIATNWLKLWGVENVLELPQNPNLLLTKVVDRLCQEKHLILLDSLEYLLTGDENHGWGDFFDPNWRKLFSQILAAPTCQSRILITSQHLPVQLQADAVRYANLWQSLVLSGLNESEQMAFFAQCNLKDAVGQVDARLLTIGQVYDGHPLALRVIAGEIKESYSGNITAYWHENRQYIEEVQQDLKKAQEQGLVEGKDDSWRLDSYTATLKRQVGSQLERAFQKLRQEQPLAYELLCYASIYRCAVTKAAWLSHLEHEGYENMSQQQALTSLGDRFLVENGGYDDAEQLLVALHNLIRSKAITHRIQLFQEG
jgi:hypothetical protein